MSKSVKVIIKVVIAIFAGLYFIGSIGVISEQEETITNLERGLEGAEATELELLEDINELEEIIADLEAQLDIVDEEPEVVVPVQPEVIDPEPIAEPEPAPVAEEEPEVVVEEPVSENPYIERLQIEIADSYVEYDMLTVVVTLVADKDYEYLDLRIPLYDEEGFLIDELWGNATGIKEGNKVKIELFSFESGVYDIEDLEVEAW